ncbi:MAG: FG-GAP-like repeat-containing protein [Nitrospirota bacterium]
MKKAVIIISIVFIIIETAGCLMNKEIMTDRSISESFFEKGVRFSQKRQYDKAELSFIEAVKSDPMNPDLHFYLGNLYLTIEKYDPAIEEFKDSLAIDNDYYNAYAGIWAAKLEKGDNSREIKEEVKRDVDRFLFKTLIKDRDNLNRLLAGYIGLRYLHDDKKAGMLIEPIIKLMPDDNIVSEISNDYMEDIISESDAKERVEMAERFLRLFPPDLHSREMVYKMLLRDMAERLDDNEGLINYGRRWLSENAGDMTANFVFGYRLTKRGIEIKKAIKYLKRAIRSVKSPDPDDRPMLMNDEEWEEMLKKREGRYYDTLGWAYFKSGDYKNADKAYNRAIEFIGDDHGLWYHIGQLYEKRGEKNRAIDAYLRSVKDGDEIREAEESLKRLVMEKYGVREKINEFYARKEKITIFRDITENAGLKGRKAMRAAWGDYNNDGYEDLLLNGNILYRNNKDGRFIDVTKEAEIPEIKDADGGVWGDFNNDGFLDFYMMTGGGNGAYGRFFRNFGDGTFIDITTSTIASMYLYNYPNEGAAWGDYDNNGFIDLYVANYEKRNAYSLAIGTPDILWKNNGDYSFVNAAREAGLTTLEKMSGRGVSWGDYNNDGLIDIFVSNYRLDPNFLWRNNGDGSFTNIAEETGVEGKEVEGLYGHTIGSEWGDYDNDGDLDLFSANLAHPRYIGFSDKSMLLENKTASDKRFFDNRFNGSGIKFEESHSEPSFGDYDNDGDLDLFITSIYGNSFLYRNDGDGNFTDITWLAGVRVKRGWGNAFADIDNDGDLDLLVAGNNGVRLFENMGNDNTWLHVRAVGTKSNRSAIGSRIKVIAGDMIQIRDVEGGKGTGNQHSIPVEFGFGDYKGDVAIDVRFPSGEIVKRENIKLNQMITVSEENMKP